MDTHVGAMILSTRSASCGFRPFSTSGPLLSNALQYLSLSTPFDAHGKGGALTPSDQYTPKTVFLAFGDCKQQAEGFTNSFDPAVGEVDWKVPQSH